MKSIDFSLCVSDELKSAECTKEHRNRIRQRFPVSFFRVCLLLRPCENDIWQMHSCAYKPVFSIHFRLSHIHTDL